MEVLPSRRFDRKVLRDLSLRYERMRRKGGVILYFMNEYVS